MLTNTVKKELITHFAINSENLEWLQSDLFKIRRRIDCVFIDPPRADSKVAKMGVSKRVFDKWQNFMKPRLEYSRMTLKATGILIALTHDRELPYMRLMLDEIFGERNFISTVVVDTGKVQNSARLVSSTHEYLLIYAKNLAVLNETGVKWRVQREGLEKLRAKERSLRSKYKDDYQTISVELRDWLKGQSFSPRLKQFYHADETGLYSYADLSAPKNGLYYTVVNPKTNEAVSVPSRGWAIKESVFHDLDKENLIIWPENANHQPLKKVYIKEKPDQVVRSIMRLPSRSASKLIQQILGSDSSFKETVDIDYMKTLIRIFTQNNATILDPFSGSGTTGHAILDLNYENPESRRRFIACAYDKDMTYSNVLLPRLQAVISGKWADRNHRPRKAILKDSIGTEEI